MANSNDIGIIVRCGEVVVGLQRLDRTTDYNDLLRLLSEMTGFDLNQYSLKVSAKYEANNMSQIFPITCNRDLRFFLDPNAGFGSVELFVDAEMVLPSRSFHDSMENTYNQYASYITGESELPHFTNYVPTRNVNDYDRYTREYDDLPCDSSGPNVSSDSEPEPQQNDDECPNEGFSDEDRNNEDPVQSTVRVAQSAPHPSLSRASFFDSSYEDVPIDSIGIPDGDFTYDDDVGILKAGMIFTDKKQLQTVVKNYSIRHAMREFAVKESTPTIWKVVCKQNAGGTEHDSSVQQCNWYLRAICSKRTTRWKITRLGPQHTCLIRGTNLRHNNLCKNLIAGMLESTVKVNPAYKAECAKVMVKDRYNYDISYHLAYDAIKRAVENVYGTWESSCQYLPKFMGALQKYNPGTIVEWCHMEREPSGGAYTLMYVFWAFKPCIDAFQHCRKIISVDGTHLYTKYKHKLLIAVTIDANQNVLPLAYAIVDEESFRSWRWFLRMLATHVVRGVEGVCLISDRHKGLLKAVEYIPDFQEPKGVHRFCLRHIASNFNTHFKSVQLKDLVYEAGKALTVLRFERIMEQIKELNHEAFEYLSAIEPCKWTFCYDQGRRFGVMTTNMSEAFNGVLIGARRLPITAIVRITFTRSKKAFFEREEAALKLQQTNQRWPDDILRNFDKEQRLGLKLKHNVDRYNYSLQTASVTTFHDGSRRSYTYIVKLSTQECSCGQWSNTGIPCSHAMAVCRHFGMDPTGYVHQCYSTHSYVLTYTSGIFEPLADEEEWDEPLFMLRHNPERRIRRRGRDVTSRIPNEMDWAQTRLRQQYQAQDRAGGSNQGSSSRRK